MSRRLPASMRTLESLSALIEGRLSSPDGRSELVKLATRLILEEGLETETALAEAELLDGKLALITNAPDPTPAEAVARYTALARLRPFCAFDRATGALDRCATGFASIERGFRVLKSDIEIAPVHHRLPDRIRAHALICFLALVLHRVMRMRLKARGHAASPRTALDLLARIQRHQAKIGERSIDGLSSTPPNSWSSSRPCTCPNPPDDPLVVTKWRFPPNRNQLLSGSTVELGFHSSCIAKTFP